MHFIAQIQQIEKDALIQTLFWKSGESKAFYIKGLTPSMTKHYCFPIT